MQEHEDTMQDNREAGFSRRKFLAGAAVGLGGVGALAVTPGWALKSSDSADWPASVQSEPLVAYVRDVAQGEIALLVGEQEVIIQDHSLAAKLARCCEV